MGLFCNVLLLDAFFNLLILYHIHTYRCCASATSHKGVMLGKVGFEVGPVTF